MESAMLELGKYTFSAEHSSAGKVVSYPLTIYKGIKLYPLRYGIFERDGKDLIRYGGNPLQGAGFYPDMKTDNYAYHPMPLRSGWLYVASEESQGVYEYYHEYHCLLKSFVAVQSKEPHQKIGSSADFIPLSNSDKVFFFFSETQLTRKYIVDSFFEGRKIKFPDKSFDCKAWSDRKTPSDMEKRHVDPEDIWICYPAYDYSLIDFHNKLIEKSIKENQGQGARRDVFFMMDDPIGVAEQLTSDLTDRHLRHEALLRSIRTGVDDESIYQKLQSIEPEALIQDEQLSTDTENAGQIKLLHMLSCYVYHLAFSKNSPGHLKKAKRSIDEKRLLEILAVNQREELRQQIDTQRKILEKFINSEVFQAYCRFFTTQITQIENANDHREREDYYAMLVDAKRCMVQIYQCLSVLPGEKDRYIDIDRSYTDPCFATLERVLAGEGDAGKLLHAEIDLYDLADDYNERTGISVNLNTLMLLCDNTINTWWRIGQESKTVKLKVAILFKDRNNLTFTVRKKEVEQYLDSIRRTRYMNIESGGRGLWKIQVSKRDFGNEILRMDTVSGKPVGKPGKIITSLAQNRVYIGIMSLLYLQSIDSIIKEYDKDARTALAQSVEFLACIGALQRRYAESTVMGRSGFDYLKKGTNKKKVIKTVQRQIRVLAAIGFFASAADNGISAREKLDSDFDSALFHAAAAVSGAVGGIATAFFAKSLSAAGWIGLAAAVLIFGFELLADYFADIDLEVFIKRTVLKEKLKGYTLTQVPWKTVAELGSPKWRTAGAAGKPVMADYRFQIEEMLFAHMCFPFFKLFAVYSFGAMISSAGSSSNPPMRFDVTVSSNLSQYGLSLDQLKIEVFYVVDNRLLKDACTPLIQGPMEPSFDLPGLQSPTGMFSYAYHAGQDKIRKFVNNQDAWIILLIRFHHQNDTVSPLQRNNVDQYLIYHYKIRIEKLNSWDYSHAYPELDYRNAKVVLDKIFIGDRKEASNL
jgi:hypothetical protein